MTTHFPAEYVTWKHMKTRGSYVLSLEIPAEGFELMRSIIGDPPKSGESKWLAVALLEKPDAP